VYFLTLITDYDGTLADHGFVAPDVVDALRKFRETGRRVMLVTGRELTDVKRVFPEVTLFDRIVAENGAVLYNPATEEERTLAPPPDDRLVARLRDLGVAPLSVGRTIVATWEPNEARVLEVIRDLGLELQIVFNKGAVMVLPPGVNKATGVLAALAEIEVSAHNAVGVGDAENDHAFLSACGCAAAVANALPVVKQSADVVLTHRAGAGVIELMDLMVRDDARLIAPTRHGIHLGTDDAGDVWLEPQRGCVLIAGSSGTGKSTVATALTEHMAERGFEFCIFDPEGDYENLEHAVSVGDAHTPPKQADVLRLLRHVGANVVVNLQALPLTERPAAFGKLLGELLGMRARLGRPHWILIDEAHHLMPAARHDGTAILPESLCDAIFLTVHPESISPDALRSVHTVIALGGSASDTLLAFADAIGEARPMLSSLGRSPDEMLIWTRQGGPPRAVKPDRPQHDRKRHTRKYAEGDVGEDRSFFFRGPNGALNLRAQNLMLFLQIAEGVDDATWEHHRRAGDYSAWFRDVIKDIDLAAEASAIETDDALDATHSRRRIAEAVRQRYTTPAKVTQS